MTKALYVLLLTHLLQNAALYSLGFDEPTFDSPGLIKATIWIRLITAGLYFWEKVEFKDD